MKIIDVLNYGPFSTDVIISDDVENFFESNDEEINLTNNINIDEWYSSWLLKYLDDDKDGVPDERYGKKFDLIYFCVVENPEDYMEIDEIIEELKINKEDVIFNGTIQISDGDKGRDKSKFWVQFIVKKK